MSHSTDDKIEREREILTSVKFDMSVTTSLVFEKSVAVVTTKGHLVRMDLVG